MYPERKAHTNLEEATENLQSGLTNEHPDWVDQDGECSSCVSMTHELADPTHIPEEILQDDLPKKAHE